MMGYRWYVVRTEPRAEFLAAAELSNKGVEVFSPQFNSVHPRYGLRSKPLFAGYLFLKCDPEANGWPSFRGATHVAGWLTFGNERPSLPEEVVAAMMEQWEAIKEQGGNVRKFEIGEKVRIIAGSIRGFAEIIQEAKLPKARAIVMLQFMGRTIEAQVPWEYLEPTSIENQPELDTRSPRRTRGKGRKIRQLEPVTV